MVIPDIYTRFSGRFIDDTFTIAVKINSLWGIINSNGEYVLDPEFKYILFSYYKDCSVKSKSKYVYTICDVNNNYSVIRNDGSLLIEPSIYDWISGFEDGYAIVCKKDLYGIINIDGDIIVDIKYRNIEPFYNTNKEVIRIGSKNDNLYFSLKDKLMVNIAGL